MRVKWQRRGALSPERERAGAEQDVQAAVKPSSGQALLGAGEGQPGDQLPE